MKTKVIKVNKSRPEAGKMEEAAAVLRRGGVIAFPTDTVYGLAASAFITEAHRKIYHLKGRSYRKPLIVMPPDLATLGLFAEITPRARRLMQEFWPGPLTLVLPTTSLGRMVMGGRQDIGARIPDHGVVLSLLEHCGFPLITTSANPSSKPSATDGATARRYFDGKVELILDAGAAPAGRESTVVDVTHFHCVVVREGCLPSKKLLEFVK